MKGYRGFAREFSRTGTWRALALQLRVGAGHVLRQWTGRGRVADPERLFLENYADDGLRAADPELRDLLRSAEACLVCGLCDGVCAAVDGSPPLDPRDAVLAGARLAIDVRRLGLARADHACASCRACEPVCPSQIPIARIQERLAALGE